MTTTSAPVEQVDRALVEELALALLQSHFRENGVQEPTELGAFDNQYRKDARVAINFLTKRTDATASTTGLEGYKDAFYEIADMLDIPAQAHSPAYVFENEMKPKLLAALRPASTNGLVERLRQYEGQAWETAACYNGLRDEAATALSSQATALAEAEARTVAQREALEGMLREAEKHHWNIHSDMRGFFYGKAEEALKRQDYCTTPGDPRDAGERL